MFKERYIKDNDLIKPDDEFLERLKSSVAQQEKVVHIGDFVDYENAEQFETLGNANDTLANDLSDERKSVKWQRSFAFAACFAIVLLAALVAKNNNIFGDKNMQADMGGFVSEELAESEQEVSDVNEACVKLYAEVCAMFENGNAVLYEAATYRQNEAGMEYVQKAKENWRQLELEEQNGMIGDIVSEQYIVTASEQGYDSVIYYMAEFENQSYVVFAVCDEQYIYIAEMSGLQSMAVNE